MATTTIRLLLLAAAIIAAAAATAAPPILVVDTPAGDLTTSQSSVAFAGTASDHDGDGAVARVEYNVNGSGWLSAAGSSNWSFTAGGLVAGENSIVVRAIDTFDRTSNQVQRTITRQVAATPPVLVVSTPPADQTIAAGQTTFGFAGSASDPDGDGAVANVEFNVNGSGWVSAGGLGSWSFTATGLVTGANSVVVRAIDVHNRTSDEARRIITRQPLSSPPLLTITTPAGDQTIGNSQTSIAFAGTADDNDGDAAVVRVEFSLNGANWIAANGLASWSFTASGLVLGENRITVRAIDTRGRTSQEIGHTITREIIFSPPLLSISAPTDNQTVANGQESIEFSGTASDDDGDAPVARVEYRVNGSAWKLASGLTNWSFTAPALVIGANRVVVRAIDTLNRTSAEIGRTVTRQALPNSPSVTIVIPPGDTSLPGPGSSLAVSGSASDADGTVVAVEYRIGESAWITASGTGNWSFLATGWTSGSNVLQVRARDNSALIGAAVIRIVEVGTASGGSLYQDGFE